MRLLIVDGWTREGNLSHAVAGCEEQAGVFASLVRECLPEADIRIVDTHSDAGRADLDFSEYDAAILTGGGGNIYEDNPFNRRQLELGRTRACRRTPRLGQLLGVSGHHDRLRRGGRAGSHTGNRRRNRHFGPIHRFRRDHVSKKTAHV